ncbi:hypothetical protein D3C71_1684700 [compost metagenome]
MQAGHQAIAWAGAEARADVQAGGQRDQQQAAHEHRDLPGQAMHFGQQPQPELRAGADQQHVEHGAQTRFLPDRPPQQQHQRADHIGGHPEGQWRLQRDAL